MEGIRTRHKETGHVSKQYTQEMRRQKEYELAVGIETRETNGITFKGSAKEHLQLAESQKAAQTVLIEELVLRKFASTAKLEPLTGISRRGMYEAKSFVFRPAACVVLERRTQSARVDMDCCAR